MYTKFNLEKSKKSISREAERILNTWLPTDLQGHCRQFFKWASII
ncbi:MAG TPA: palindromic element RPE5 domain-containing protein [Rickettsia endosymbiont of Omalisus fontisbellaquei]|nr:palindromic element RPE5 domain-containing protein [Rickettsia endosymbiont of Omalisus fontisbellaquei]